MNELNGKLHHPWKTDHGGVLLHPAMALGPMMKDAFRLPLQDGELYLRLELGLRRDEFIQRLIPPTYLNLSFL